MERIIDPSGQNATVSFADALIPVTYDHGRPRIVMKHIFTDLGLDYSSALKDLKSKTWAELALHTAHADDGRKIRMQTATPGTFLIWLTRLTKVPTEMKPRLARYQRETMLALTEHANQAFTPQERKLP